MKVQTVIRTRKKQSSYLHEPDAYATLKKLLNDGWIVVLCNEIGDDLEYILERRVEE